MAREDTIAKGGVVLTANADGLVAGLRKGEQKVRGWADNVVSGLADRFKGIGLGAAAGIGAGVLALTRVNDTLADIAQGGAAAKAFGMSAEQYTGMAGLAESVGMAGREFTESLVTLSKLASDGAAGNGEVAVEWFKSLNLNAAEFKNLRLDQQFFKTFDALRAVQDPAERVRSLMVAFGEDGGKSLLPLLSKAPADLRAMAAGFTISTDAVERATRANAAYKEAGASLTAVWRDFAVSAAPAVESMARHVADLAKGWKEAGDAMERARAAAPALPGGGSGERGWVDGVWNALPDAREVGASVRASEAMIRDGWAKIRNKGAEGRAALYSFLTGHEIKPTFEDAGRTDRFLKALNEPPAGPAAELPDGVRNLIARAEAAGEAGRVWAKGIAAQNKLSAVVDTLAALPAVDALAEKARGLTTLADRWHVAPGDAGPWRAGDPPAGPTRFAGAVEANSREAYSITLANRLDGSAKRAEDGQKEATREFRKATGVLEDILGRLDDVASRLGVL